MSLRSSLSLLKHNFSRQSPFAVQSDKIHIDLALRWLKHAQDIPGDGGFSVKYSLKFPQHFYPSYPETTGYIIPSLLAANELNPSTDLLTRAQRAADWLLSLQSSEGWFPGGHTAWPERWGKPSIFNTGQILLGLIGIQRSSLANARYADAAQKAGRWMLSVMKEDGSYQPIYSYVPDATYYIQATYGLALAGDYLKNGSFLVAAERNLSRALARHHADGWIDGWGFNDPMTVLHGIVYTLRGIYEVGQLVKSDAAMQKLSISIDKLLTYVKKNKKGLQALPPSHYGDHWSKTDRTWCLTGAAQLAVLLYKTAKTLNRSQDGPAADQIVEGLKCCQLQGFSDPNLDGGLQGSWPIWGHYQPWELINWAPKFFLDSLLLKNGISLDSIL